MNSQKQLFAFKLAEKQAEGANESNGKWKIRDGIASAQSCCLIGMIEHLAAAIPPGDVSTLC